MCAFRGSAGSRSPFLYDGGSDMVEVYLEDGDRIDAALRVFKKKVQRAGVLQDIRKRRHYVKPSEARQLKMAAARRRGRSGGRSPR